MTDTHDTNLPEKPAELEEEKKETEAAEPVMTEAPADEAAPEEPARKPTKAEILAKLKELVAHTENAVKPEIDSLKQAFYKLHNAEQEAARRLFVENGGAEEDFIPQADSVEEEFKHLMSVVKEKRGKAQGDEPASQALHHRRTERTGGVCGRPEQELRRVQETATTMERGAARSASQGQRALEKLPTLCGEVLRPPQAEQ